MHPEGMHGKLAGGNTAGTHANKKPCAPKGRGNYEK